MNGVVGQKSALTWAVHISVALLVALWLFPTVGLFVSSFRTGDQIATSGGWDSFSTQERQNPAVRFEGAAVVRDGRARISFHRYNDEDDLDRVLAALGLG